MNYADMHCDTLTESLKSGKSFFDGSLQSSVKNLEKSGCAAQCFAIFTQGDSAAAFFDESFNYYKNTLESGAEKLVSVTTAADLAACVNGQRTGAVLTVENLGFLHGDTDRLFSLAEKGVKMASLVWNFENEFAYPNIVFENGLPKFEKRERRGLKTAGRKAVEALDSLKIIIDLSHLSDGGAEEILQNRKIPVVASHSNAAEVCNVSRNLTDEQIKMIADCGGVVGVNFCKDFLGSGTTAAQTFDEVYRHISHIIKVGGEDVVALGGDFDGIPPCAGLEDCAKLPNLFNYLSDRGISGGIAEKLLYKNFLRVFKDVCGE